MRLNPYVTYSYVKPTDKQVAQIARVGVAAKAFSDVLEAELIDSHDKAHVLRMLRTAVMWANVAITRDTDGSPRMDGFNPRSRRSDEPDTQATVNPDGTVTARRIECT